MWCVWMVSCRCPRHPAPRDVHRPPSYAPCPGGQSRFRATTPKIKIPHPSSSGTSILSPKRPPPPAQTAPRPPENHAPRLNHFARTESFFFCPPLNPCSQVRQLQFEVATPSMWCVWMVPCRCPRHPAPRDVRRPPSYDPCPGGGKVVPGGDGR